ncbi:thioredoxin domain-containing protein [Enterocloster hominis (ex Hitch et al. 2024)]|uniref:thioredoxin domain-containing protein n=1 Tax=Enterocloster hominis (ex Hitch et al. 2024) TaxID=1917870 RepID=UPI001F1E2CB6|nr:thioredoxin domain-containing protein [Lachnoclostridium pacaense]
MERESFENEGIAGILNRDYICIKVDREERPDVDSVYMSVCQAMNGQGGWPLTIIMTPDCRPFFSGTYFPPKARYGRVGLEELLAAVSAQWKGGRERLLEGAGRIEAFLKEQEQADVSAEPGLEVVHRAFRLFGDGFDKMNGGFGQAPKFPTPHNLMFLMEYGVRENKPGAVDMAIDTLVQMYRGGIFDHIGGGFSRYSTDEWWLVPHFEKMLYDNALLAMAYAKAYGLTGRGLYARVVQRILGYVEAELTHASGGFYCGQDADSDGVEGRYYVFTPEEIKQVLGPEDGADFCSQFGITGIGNFEGKNIPNLLGNEDYETAGEETSRRKLYEYRIRRAHLHKDDKILVSWNGWMICACAMAGAVLGAGQYVDMAVRAEAFIRTHLVKDGRLRVRYRDGDAAGQGKLDDYACYALALLELYEVTFGTGYLEQAVYWAKTMVLQFFDRERGGFYLYAEDGEQLIVRTKEAYDGAVPSGNSAAARVLQQLAQITGEVQWQEILDKQLHYLAGAMAGYPPGHSYGLLVMMDVLYPTKELVCVLSPSYAGEERTRLLARLGYLGQTTPGLSVTVKTEDNAQALGELAPYTRDYPLPGKGAAFYLCSGGNCMPMVTELEEVVDKLQGLMGH